MITATTIKPPAVRTTILFDRDGRPDPEAVTTRHPQKDPQKDPQ
jgi:hypothetical protein